MVHERGDQNGDDGPETCKCHVFMSVPDIPLSAEVGLTQFTAKNFGSGPLNEFKKGGGGEGELQWQKVGPEAFHLSHAEEEFANGIGPKQAVEEVNEAIKMIALPTKHLIKRMASEGLPPGVVRHLRISVMGTHGVEAEEEKDAGVGEPGKEVMAVAPIEDEGDRDEEGIFQHPICPILRLDGEAQPEERKQEAEDSGMGLVGESCHADEDRMAAREVARSRFTASVEGMPQVSPPDPREIQKQLAQLRDEPVSYAHGAGIDEPPAAGFLVDRHRTYLGEGRAVFEQASQWLRQWRQFPKWCGAVPEQCPQEPGHLVASVMRLMGLWWVNPCRILQRIEEPKACGFVFGTLPPHPECGEERFLVEMRDDGSVWYRIDSFSRPRYWMAWLGFPLARWWQLKFVRDSQQAMREGVTQEKGP